MSYDTPPPWQKFPSLTEQRLRAIAEIIRDVRHKAVMTHEPHIGDDEWVLGCRSYKRVCYEIAKSSIGRFKDWLSIVEEDSRKKKRVKIAPAVLNPELHFVFAIGGVPLRFYKGAADEPTGKALNQRHPEIDMFQLALEFVQAPEFDKVLRLAVETDEIGEVERVVLVELDLDGKPYNPWVIPLETAPKVTQFRAQDKEKELGEPRVGSKRKREEDEQSS